MRIKFAFLLATSLVVLTACDSEKPVEKPVTSIAEPKATPNKAVKDTLIRNDNVVERLTEFGKNNPETKADIYTRLGKIRIQLFEDTPLHRANFIMLAKSGYFNGTVFTRVVKNFIAQGGSAHSYQQVDIQRGIGLYTVPAEFTPKHIHKQGMLAAARDYEDNPEKRSDPFVFYLVEGTTYSDETLDHYEKDSGRKFSKYQRDYYTKKPGAAHIDNEHTVFGKIISGYSVVPKLTSVKTDKYGWPDEDLFIDSVVVVR